MKIFLVTILEILLITNIVLEVDRVILTKKVKEQVDANLEIAGFVASVPIKKGKRSSYDPVENSICIKTLDSIMDQIVFLHEYGHYQDFTTNSKVYKWFYVGARFTSIWTFVFMLVFYLRGVEFKGTLFRITIVVNIIAQIGNWCMTYVSEKRVNIYISLKVNKRIIKMVEILLFNDYYTCFD